MFASFLLGFLAEVQNKNVSVIIINQSGHLSAYQEICLRLAEEYFCLPGIGLLPINNSLSRFS